MLSLGCFHHIYGFRTRISSQQRPRRQSWQSKCTDEARACVSIVITIISLLSASKHVSYVASFDFRTSRLKKAKKGKGIHGDHGQQLVTEDHEYNPARSPRNLSLAWVLGVPVLNFESTSYCGQSCLTYSSECPNKT